MGTTQSSIDNKQDTATTNTKTSSSKQTAIKPVITTSSNKCEARHDSIFLIVSYCRLIINDKGKYMMPSDIINIIFMYFHLIFHFDVIPKIKECGTKNILDHNDDGYELETVVAVAVDSECIYVGIAGDDHPILSVPNIISIGNNNNILIGHQLNNAKFNLSASIRPFQCGEIKDYDAMKQLLLKIFSKNMNIDDKKNIILTECVPFLYREEITKFAFEELKCSKFYLISRSVLSLYASGRTTGIVIHSDYECTEIVPVYDGYSVKKACKKINFGKRDIIDYLDEKRYNEYDEESGNGMELFFDKINIHKEIWQCILKCVDLNGGSTQKEYYNNIVLSGINTMYRGLDDRLYKELVELVNDSKVKIIAPPEREYSAWIGASILGSLSTFEEMWITKEQYDETGPSIVHKKCDS